MEAEPHILNLDFATRKLQSFRAVAIFSDKIHKNKVELPKNTVIITPSSHNFDQNFNQNFTNFPNYLPKILELSKMLITSAFLE